MLLFQPNFLYLVWLSMGYCPALFHRSSLVILSCHLMGYVYLRHALKNVCKRCVEDLVVPHVSQALRSIDFHIHREAHMLVCVEDAELGLCMDV